MRKYGLFVLLLALAILVACGPTSPGPTATPAPTGDKCISATEASKHIGEFVCVEYCIVRTYNSGKAAFLNSHDPYQGYFYVVVFPERWDCWPKSPEDYFRSKCIRVQGKIQMYKGSPEIIVRNCNQIQVVR